MEPMEATKVKPEHVEEGNATEAPKEPEITQTDHVRTVHRLSQRITVAD